MKIMLYIPTMISTGYENGILMRVLDGKAEVIRPHLIPGDMAGNWEKILTAAGTPAPKGWDAGKKWWPVISAKNRPCAWIDYGIPADVEIG